MSRERLVQLFNEWMRRYEKDPTEFEADLVSVKRYLEETQAGLEPTYGHECAAYLLQLDAELP